MKKLKYIGFLLTLFSGTAMAQSTTENYVMTETMLDANGTSSMSSVQYYNGLGFPTVAVTTVGGNGEAAYSLTTYDASGREECNYLPVAIGNSMIYRSPEDIIKTSASANNGDKTAYTQNHYDALNRVTSVELPGWAWRDNDKRNRTEFSVNTLDDYVRIYKANPKGNLSLQNTGKYYPAGSLTKEVQKDADDKTVVTFKDFLGNVILQRANDGTNNLDTYYVYDDLGRLCYVLSPQYQNTKDKAISAYEYRYDEKGRIYKKKLPGCEIVQYWYDNADRVVCTQDGYMRKNSPSIARFSIYDNFGRLVIQGLCSNWNSNSTFLRDSCVVAKFDPKSEGFMGTGYVLQERFARTIKTNTVLEIVNYYDGNQSKVKGSFKEHFNGVAFSYVDVDAQKGQLTGTVTLAGSIDLKNREYLATVMEYDIKGNLIKSKSRELDGYLATNTNSYTFTNNIKTSTTKLNINSEEFTLNESFDYNKFNNKMEKKFFSISDGKDSGTSEASYGYDELGRLSSKNGRRYSRYSYDMRGWLTWIGNVDFEEKLIYTYNGNISAMIWEQGGLSPDGKEPRRYDFTYDGANRLTDSKYCEFNNLHYEYMIGLGKYNESVTYDLNGNITTVKRNGQTQTGGYGLIDNLSLTYNGNQISYVSESAPEVMYNGSFDYKGYNKSRYMFNENGSLIADESRGIMYIKYDFNNNPIKIYFANGNETEYVYSASGQKLRVKHITAKYNVASSINRTFGKKPTSDLPESLILYTTTTDYLLGGNFVLLNGNPDKYHFEDGYCSLFKESNPITNVYWRDFDFYYYNKDHLGNIRDVVDANGKIKEITQYYPFGTPYAEKNDRWWPVLTPQGQRKYNGKELDNMHGLNTYDYGARQYDPVLARWDRMDPLCEKYYNVSPYTYCHNNPVMMIDPDGKDDYTINLVSGCITITPTQANTHSFYIENKEQTKFIGSYSYNDNNLIGMSGNISFENFDGQDCKITFKPGNDSEQYMSPLALGALIGSTAEVGASDVYVNHFSNSDGSSPKPSKSHKNGVNGDLRYFRSDSNGNPIIGPGNITDKSFDEKREIPFVNALHKYGWTNMISERYNGKLLPYSRSAKELGIPSNHANHLHLQGFNPKVKQVYNGGVLTNVTIRP